jgi:DsbC/DsbD-like thiol-disulfide interchange protein
MVALLLMMLSGSVMQGSAQLSPDFVQVTVPEVSTESGTKITVVVGVKIRNGYHIQGHSLSDEYLVPTTIEARGNKSIVLEEQEFPDSKSLTLAGSDDPLRVYDGNLEVHLVVKVGESVPRGIAALSATLQYQACDARSCLSPRTLDFVIPIRVQ